MTSTYSPTLRTELPATGDQNNTWATTFDNNWNVPIEQGISGVVSVALPDSNFTLTTANAATDQARMAVIIFTGALTAQRTITAPAVPKVYILRNNTNQRLLIVTAGVGTTVATDTGIPQPRSAAPYSSESAVSIPKPGVIVPAGTTAYVWTDGTLFDYCVNGFDGSVSADSIVLPSPLPVGSGGTSATTASDARTSLGLGSAATSDASVLNNPNQVVQRDASGGFVANTITAGLNGTAATSNNTSLLGNLPTSAYATASTSWNIQGLGDFNITGPAVVDIVAIAGPGPYLVEILGGLGPEDTLRHFFAIQDGTISDTARGIGQFIRVSSSFFALRNVYKFRKLF